MNETSGKKSLGIFLLCFLGCVLTYLSIFYQQFGPYIPAEYWLRNVAIVKQQLCQRTPSPKVVILSGSNALFGFDSHQLEHFLGRPVINFGLHAGLPLGYILNRYNLGLRPGDMVIIPLEYELYETAEVNTSWFTTQVIAWDRDYFDQLSVIEKIRFIISVPPLRLLANLAYRLVRERREVPTQQTVMDTVEQVWRSGRYRNEYHFENLNDRGDMERRQNIHVKSSPDYPIFEKNFHISGYARAHLSKFIAKCRRNGVQVIVTWPCIIDGKRLDTSKEDVFKNNIYKIKAFMATQDVILLGEPMDFCFPKHFFYDTKYHLGQIGRQLRTLKLAELMLQERLFQEQAANGAKLMEIDNIVSSIRKRTKVVEKIQHLYWNLGKASEAIRILEHGLDNGYLNGETIPILLDYLSKNRNPSLHSHITDILASPRADINGYDIGGNAYLMGTTPDGWTTGRMPGYLLLKEKSQRHQTRKIRLNCNASRQTLPLTVTLQDETEEFYRTFDRPGEIEIDLPEKINGDARLFIVRTDKYWIPMGPDNRELGVQIRIE